MMTDPIADMLTRIRNANRIERPAVDMPATRLKQNVAQVLKDEGFIVDYQVGRSATDEQGHTAFQTEETIRPGTVPELKPRDPAEDPPDYLLISKQRLEELLTFAMEHKVRSVWSSC